MNPPWIISRLVLVILIGVALVSAARAEEPPKFASPEVNDYVKRQTAWMDEWIAALEAGDYAKKSEVFKKMSEDMDKNVAAIREKLTDAEQPVFSKWRDDETRRMQNAVPPPQK